MYEHWVETAGGRLYLEVEGDPDAVLVLLAAGGPGASHEHYHPWFSRLTPEFRVGYVDYIGCGRSDRLSHPSGYAVPLLAANLEAVRRRLDAPTCVIGISFGGFAAVEYALSRPDVVRRLVLSNAQVDAAAWQRTNIDGVNVGLARLSPAAGARSWRCARRAFARSSRVIRSSSALSAGSRMGRSVGSPAADASGGRYRVRGRRLRGDGRT